MNNKRLREWCLSCQVVLNTVRFDQSDEVKVVAVSLLHLAFEHHVSICNLVNAGHHGSAFALFRPQKEAFLRGVWLLYCADAKQINEFKRLSKLPPMKRIICDLKTTEHFNKGHLFELLSSLKKDMDDFTHGGGAQAAMRVQGQVISSKYPEQTVQNLLSDSMLLSCFTVIHISKVGSDANMEMQTLEAYRRLVVKRKHT